ncbi:Outer membrane protein [Bacteroides xylanisolvens]|nr:Outer membrane protein [Bacteroides xylanisolvens]
MQKKVQSAQQERMIFIQSKQKQIQSMVESQAAQIAKEKGIGIVMHKRAVPGGAVDITDEVMAKIDGTSKAASGAASSASK